MKNGDKVTIITKSNDTILSSKKNGVIVNGKFKQDNQDGVCPIYATEYDKWTLVGNDIYEKVILT